jgi:polyvinyl alcohol dehydrogenase (cytochrome)
MKYWSILPPVLIAALSLSGQGVSKRTDGAAIFEQKCAVCHRNVQQTRAPSRELMGELSREYILRSLETGLMSSVGRQLAKKERIAVADFLSTVESAPQKSRGGYCTGQPAPVSNAPGWGSWGLDLENRRSVPQALAGLDRADVPKLRLKWAFAFPGAYATYGQPTVFGGKLYVGSEVGTVYSLDARTGCIYWTFNAPFTVKTAVVPGFGGTIVFFGDVGGNIYSVNSSNGKVVWKTHVDSHPAARITGSPVFYNGRLYVPVSSGEEGSAIDPKYPCCSFRGSLVALDGKTGKEIWKSYTLPDAAHPTGQRNTAGTPLWGPSGAAVWSAPTIDVKKRTVYVATGNSYSDPPSPYTDAVIAFRMKDGKMLWHRQLTPDDRWNIACVAPGRVNCPANPGHDFDFGSPPMLQKLPGGRRALIIGQKSGVVYALDPDHGGKVIWDSRIGKGGPLGGIQWGGAAEGKYVYFPLSDWDPNDPKAGGGLFTLQAATGDRVWYAAPPKPACENQLGCSAAQSAPPTAIPGVVFSGSEDGHVRAYDSTDGKLLWDYDTLQNFHAVNGIVARGGSINATGPTVVDGMVYIEAGYTNNIDGNALLAFSVNGQ